MPHFNRPSPAFGWLFVCAWLGVGTACTGPNPAYVAIKVPGTTGNDAGNDARTARSDGAVGTSDAGASDSVPWPPPSDAEPEPPNPVDSLLPSPEDSSPLSDTPPSVVDAFAPPDAGSGDVSVRPADAGPDVAVDPSVDITTGLVGYWPFEEGNNNAEAIDHSGNANGGVVMLDTKTAWKTGKVGSALEIPDTLGAGVTVRPSASIDGIRGGMTIAAWVYRDSNITDRNTAVASRQLRGTSSEIYALSFQNNILMAWMYAEPPAANVNLRSRKTAPLTTWVHVALTYDGGTVHLYQDGEDVGSIAYTTLLIPSGNPLVLGNNMNITGADQPLIGRLDEVRVYNRALPHTAIVALMSTVPPAFP